MYTARGLFNDLYRSGKARTLNDVRGMLDSGKFSLADGTLVKAKSKNGKYKITVDDQKMSFTDREMRLMEIEIFS